VTNLKMSVFKLVIVFLINNSVGFKLNGHHDHVHNGDHEEREGKAAVSSIVSRGQQIDFSGAVPVIQRDGSIKNCVEREEFRTEIKKDPILECTHSNVEKCHYTYLTAFEPNIEEVCEESFSKICSITYRKIAVNETFTHCYKPLVRDCSAPATGEDLCRTYYESSCSTRYVEKEEGKFVGDTSCEKLPVSLCGDVSCMMVPGEEECHDKMTASVIEQPEELCDLSPQKTCRHKTTLVPRLKPSQECTIVPKEV